ncbi:MAG: radical SAM protein [Bacteroidales bacterium]|nr:radical SAM protein [Bacteroidales bacterium]
MTEAVSFIGIDRHRLGADGRGVTTLAAFHGCPLRCKYCLNRRCLESAEGLPTYTPEQLFKYLSIDNLYFIATGGGVCFGGGEPLLHSDFICEFKEHCGKSWNITVESSLNVPQEAVATVVDVVGDFIVDIKESNLDIYRAYTGQEGGRAWDNLRFLLSAVGPRRIMVRVPLIEGYNTEADTAKTIAALTEMGITNIDSFKYLTDR